MSDISPSNGPLDSQSATPLYIQLAEIIGKQIASGALAPDRPIPSENRMAEEYGVARLTARRATQELRERGLVITVRGKGSYVMPATGNSTPSTEE
ncbi:GntR family transcriptional regulator [Streptomyces sp. NPDC058583]|uniref:GntR family transcriptional regulator n=1 Tax=unclassified Streptomyces TaxID=2593676 RepID=UPI0036501C8D